MAGAEDLRDGQQRRLAGDVVAQLRLRQLKPDEMLERGASHRLPDGWIGQRVDRRVRIPGPALTPQNPFNLRRQCSSRTMYPGGRLRAGVGTNCAIGEVQGEMTDPLCHHLIAAPDDDVEIRQHHLTGGSGDSPESDHVEGGGRDHLVAHLLATGSHVGDRRRHVDGGRIGAPGRIEQRDIARSGRDADMGTGAAEREHAAFHNAPLAGAGREKGENQHGQEAELHCG